MSGLKEYLGDRVKVLTSDGRLFIGLLEGYDQNMNIVLTKSEELIFSMDKPTIRKNTSGILIRGDDIVSVGMIDEDLEKSVEYNKIFATNLKTTKRSFKIK
ncbi:hypothetical protein DAPK24_026690 [Pichia kluyveri]|uniref:LSM2-LSM8 complex subunit LSM8 n=1 Tax=Pichia kluyveri TaxID=36015 RepID=A0AAV5R3R0_PICKL|nr:hypothetical protein DAPK24_026690 [Pichia kluyveri]